MTPIASFPTTIDAGLKRYLDEIRRYPILEAEQEFLLGRRWRENGDRAAANRLVTSHLRLVVKLAFGYRGYGLPMGEIISEGNVGLMRAVERFEPDRGFRFASYAIWWIKASIQEYILRSKSLVKMGTTSNQKRLFFNLRKIKSRIAAIGDGDMHPQHVAIVAEELGVPEQDVIDMNRRLGGDVSLNAPISEGIDSGMLQDRLVDEGPRQEQILVESQDAANGRKALAEALTLLSERERRIFAARRLAETPRKLEELASTFGVSRERVRQIEARAFEKVRKAVRREVASAAAPAAAAA